MTFESYSSNIKRVFISRYRHLATCIAFVVLITLFAPLPAFAERRDTDVIGNGSTAVTAFPEADRPDLSAQEAFVVKQDGTVLFTRDPDKEVKIASITKVMTALVTLEHAKASDVITIDHAAATVGESSAGLAEGDKVSRDDALRGLLTASGNDAALALASNVGLLIDPASTNPTQTFVDAMNKTAQKLGMNHTVFANPHGLDFNGWEGDFHSTARDVATMFAHAMKNQEFRTLVAQPNDVSIQATAADGSTHELKLAGHNKILGQEGNIGGKTGTTYDADDCFAGAFSQDKGGEIYTVVLGCPTDEARWTDTLALARWYYGHVVDYPVVTTKQQTVNGNPLVARATNADWTDKTVQVTVQNADDAQKTVQVFSLDGKITEKADLSTFSGSVSRGQSAGTLKVFQQGKQIASVPLAADEDQAGPNPFEWVLVHLDQLVRMIRGEETSAPSELVAQTPSVMDLDATA